MTIDQIETIRGADILVFDDHPLIRMAMELFYSRLGYRVACLEHLEDLQSLGAGKTPLRWSLLLLDFEGVESTKKVHSTILWLGFTGVAYLHTGVELPGSLLQDSWIEGVLAKPVSPDRLEAIIKEAKRRFASVAHDPYENVPTQDENSPHS